MSDLIGKKYRRDDATYEVVSETEHGSVSLRVIAVEGCALPGHSVGHEFTVAPAFALGEGRAYKPVLA